jgi:hypothetical protein
LPPRNNLEAAWQIIQAKYANRGGVFKLLDVDLVLASLDYRERIAARDILAAFAAINGIEKACNDISKKDYHFTTADEYELEFCWLIESSRAKDGKTLDAITIQRSHAEGRQETVVPRPRGWKDKLLGG